VKLGQARVAPFELQRLLPTHTRPFHIPVTNF
jgi:hypothetical protein